jgi:hypothetical protein
MVCAHTDDWVFATITCIKRKPAFYYGFALEAGPLQRTLWFKSNAEQRELSLGPVVGQTHTADPPLPGTLVVGRVIGTHNLRYLWWYRDAVPMQLLVSVAHGQWSGRNAELCRRARYEPDTRLDNLWVFIRIILLEDLDMLAESRTTLRLDRPVERFVADMAQLFGRPGIFHAYCRMLTNFRKDDVSPDLASEMHDLEEMVTDVVS